ncbi:MAG TPA: hypothetical protein VI365_34540 [Trebonia sp.]
MVAVVATAAAAAEVVSRTRTLMPWSTRTERRGRREAWWKDAEILMLRQAAPLRQLPDGITDLDQFRVQRRDRAGGMIHEYRLVA